MRGWAARIKNREKEKVIIDSTIVSRDNRERVNAIEWNVFFFGTFGGEIINTCNDLKGAVTTTSSLSRVFFFFFFFAKYARVAKSDAAIFLACYARLVRQPVNKFYRPRWQSSRMTQAFAPASLISITIGRLQSSPINARFIFKQWNRLYDRRWFNSIRSLRLLHFYCLVIEL